SFGIPFALVPLVIITRRAGVMGDMVNRRSTTALMIVITAIISLLNVYLLYDTAAGLL
nr:divalent metal cation transporter [Solirubrobacterales bacterium]